MVERGWSGQRCLSMSENRYIALEAVDAIRQALDDAKTSGRVIEAVFIGTDLRYLIAALRENPLKFSLEKGETIFGIKVIRYMSDDLSQFFLATSHPVSADTPVNPVHRPYTRKQDEL